MTDRREPTDALEFELQSLRPAELSPELTQRIGRRLDLATPGPERSECPDDAFATPREEIRPFAALRSRHGLTWHVAAAAAVAACVVVAFLTWRPGPPGTGDSTDTWVTTLPSGGAPEPDDRPALAVYHRAMSDSPDALDGLLDRHAARSLPGGGPGATGSRVTASSNFALLR